MGRGILPPPAEVHFAVVAVEAVAAIAAAAVVVRGTSMETLNGEIAVDELVAAGDVDGQGFSGDDMLVVRDQDSGHGGGEQVGDLGDGDSSGCVLGVAFLGNVGGEGAVSWGGRQLV